nr:hypothetical protein CFP56_09906 [Quercus suber]
MDRTLVFELSKKPTSPVPLASIQGAGLTRRPLHRDVPSVLLCVHEACLEEFARPVMTPILASDPSPKPVHSCRMFAGVWRETCSVDVFKHLHARTTWRRPRAKSAMSFGATQSRFLPSRWNALHGSCRLGRSQ